MASSSPGYMVKNNGFKDKLQMFEIRIVNYRLINPLKSYVLLRNESKQITYFDLKKNM